MENVIVKLVLETIWLFHLHQIRVLAVERPKHRISEFWRHIELLNHRVHIADATQIADSHIAQVALHILAWLDLESRKQRNLANKHGQVDEIDINGEVHLDCHIEDLINNLPALRAFAFHIIARIELFDDFRVGVELRQSELAAKQTLSK